jgi:hypothetical protein
MMGIARLEAIQVELHRSALCAVDGVARTRIIIVCMLIIKDRMSGACTQRGAHARSLILPTACRSMPRPKHRAALTTVA